MIVYVYLLKFLQQYCFIRVEFNRNCDLQKRERERIIGATEENYGDIDRKSAMSICNY